MICPQCNTEYQDHVKMCADCHVLLTEVALKEIVKSNNDDLNLVQILSLNDWSLVVIAKSLLDEAEIPAMVRNENLQDLFGFGQLTFNPVSGAVDFYVKAEDEARAREVLADICTETGF